MLKIGQDGSKVRGHLLSVIGHRTIMPDPFHRLRHAAGVGSHSSHQRHCPAEANTCRRTRLLFVIPKSGVQALGTPGRATEAEGHLGDRRILRGHSNRFRQPSACETKCNSDRAEQALADISRRNEVPTSNKVSAPHSTYVPAWFTHLRTWDSYRSILTTASCSLRTTCISLFLQV